MSAGNLIRFKNISKTKEGLFAHFSAKGERAGVTFSASIVVDIASMEIDLSEDNLERIIEECARFAVKEFKKSEFEFEGIQVV